MKRPQPLRCAVAGLGRIGSLLEDDPLREKPASHAGAAAADPNCLLVAGSDIDRERRLAFRKRWECRRLYADPGRMLEKEAVQILCIATPTPTHGKLVRLACRYRVPLVICEKPLAPTAKEARGLVELCRQSGAVLMVNHERRYSADYLHVRRRIREETYGKLMAVAARLCIGRNRKASDMLLHDGTHLIDVLRFLTRKEFSEIRRFGDPSSSNTPMTVLFRLGDCQGVLSASGGHDSLLFELDLLFRSGRIRIGNGLYEEYESRPSPFYQGMRSLKRLEGIGFPKTGYFAGMLADAVRTLRRPGRRPVSSGLDGLRAVEVIEEILA